MHKLFKTTLATVLALVAATAVAFPTRTISIVVPYAAGGSTDVLARVVADAMTRDLGQAVIIENLGGAGGTIGSAKVARASKDGYTLLLHNMGMATAPALYSKLPYDVIKDFEPIALAGDVPMILVRNPRFEPATLAELVKFMKAKPGEVRFAHAGLGSTSHLCAALINETAKTTSIMVPYRGTGPALNDVLAGTVDLICDQPVATGPHIQAGALKPYAIASRERAASLPTVPTFSEAGLNGFELTVWHGLYAPKGTPQPVIERLNKALATALNSPEVAKRLSEMGVVIPAGERLQPAALATQTAAEVKRWGPILKAAGAKIE